nr:MAG TPA: hypothetical protein [Caudoviricetes sp.]
MLNKRTHLESQSTPIVLNGLGVYVLLPGGSI